MAYNLIITDRTDELTDKLVRYLLHKLHNPDAAVLYLGISMLEKEVLSGHS